MSGTLSGKPSGKPSRLTLTALTACSLVGLALAPGAAMAGEASFHLDTKAPAPRQLEVDASWLDVHVTRTSGDQVSIQADFKVKQAGSDEKAQKFADKNKVTVEKSGDRLIIRQGEKSQTNWSFGSLHLEGRIDVGLPAGVSMKVGTSSGDIEVNGDFADATLSTSSSSGDVTVTGQVRELQAEQSSGSLVAKLTHPLQKFQGDSSSGSISLKGGALSAAASSSSGDIELENLAGSAKATASSGSITLSWDKFGSGSSIDANASSGDVTIHLPAGVLPGGRVSSSSGDIHTDQTGLPGDGRHDFRLAGNDGKILVETSSGDITIKHH